jgi:hypothetical protein
MSKCQNCGRENDEDATFCENCGANLKTTLSSRTYPKEPKNKENMSQSTKILIVVCVILVAGLGITAGALMQMNKSSGTVATNTSSVTQSPTQVTNQATWHEVTSFTGTADDMRSFSTKGNQFKVVMSATPQQNYNTNSMQVDVSNSNNNLITSGSLSWTSTEAISQKEKSIVVTTSPGTYYLTITTNSLTGWTVNVYDYY